MTPEQQQQRIAVVGIMATIAYAEVLAAIGIHGKTDAFDEDRSMRGAVETARKILKFTEESQS